MAAVLQHTAVAVVLALGSERTAIAAVARNLVQGEITRRDLRLRV